MQTISDAMEAVFLAAVLANGRAYLAHCHLEDPSVMAVVFAFDSEFEGATVELQNREGHAIGGFSL